MNWKKALGSDYMKTHLIFIGLALTAASCLALSGKAWAGGPGGSQYYTYNYDFWGEARESPNPYNVEAVLFGCDLGIGNFRDPQGLFARDGQIWIVDSGNNRIVECDKNWNLVRVIDEFMLDGVPDTFNYPHDVFVTEAGNLYVADTNNQRIVEMDKDLNAVLIITKPENALMDMSNEFLPTKLVADTAGRIYLLARNTNKGLMEFDARGSFTGYVGANKVNFSIADMIWKTISTRAQRDQMALFVPTEYNNVALDHKGFLFTTCSSITEDDLMNLAFYEENDLLAKLFGAGQSSNVEPIRRLNAMGADILIRNGWVSPIGDWQWDDRGEISGPSRFVDIASAQNDSYFALDRVRARVFAYDFQGNLLYVFGGLGNKAGYFQYPTAIEYTNGSILVLDGRAASVTVFTPTAYGALIEQALNEYIKGNYALSASIWEQALVYNVNYDLAYIGLGRALMREERYKEAMYYFKLKYDRVNYSKAFQQYRKQVIEKNINIIVGGLIGLIVLRTAYKHTCRLWRLKYNGRGRDGNGIGKAA